MYKDFKKDTTQRNVRIMLNMINPVYREEGNNPIAAYYDYQKAIFSRNLWTTKRSCVRIVPGNDGKKIYPQNINVDNYSQDADQLDFLSDTFYMTNTVSNFGDSHLEFISNLRPGSNEALTYEESPINYFCSTIHRTVQRVLNGKKTSVKCPMEWRTWCGLGGALPFPKATLLFQAVCFELNGKMCTKGIDSEEEAPLYCVLGLNNNLSIQALVEALVHPMDRRKPIGPANSNYGALAEMEGNIIYFHPSVNKDEKKEKKYLSPGLGENKDDWQETPYNLPEDFCKAVWQPWDKMLNYLNCEEQVKLLAKEFGDDTVNYVFSLDHTWDSLPIPDNIRAAGLGRYSDITISKSIMKSVPKPVAKPSKTVSAAEPDWNPPKFDNALTEQINKIKKATQVNSFNPADLADELLNGDDE